MGKYVMQNTCNYDDYEVYASFTEDNKRTFADVIKKNYINHPIDVYMVLINPGSCTPTGTTDMKEADYFLLSKAAADPAMRCVMRFMEKCDLHKIRILNLIDSRNPRLKDVLKDVKGNKIKSEDSIFSDKHEEEFNLLTQGAAPFILAWGVAPELNDLKQQAMDRIKRRIQEWVDPKDIIGVPGKDGGLSFKYIKPWSVMAQDEMINDLSRQYDALRKN